MNAPVDGAILGIWNEKFTSHMILFVTIGWQNEKHYNVGDDI